MAAVQQKSTLASLLGDRARKAHEQHKTDETWMGIVNLPAGITGGVAQLVMAKWDKYDEKSQNKEIAGKPYVLLRAVVITPKMHGDILCEGQGAMITLPLCDTPSRKNRDGGPKMLEDNWAEMLNEFRKLGVDTSTTGPDDVEAILQALEQQKPYTRFSTRGWMPPALPNKPKPKELVFTQFDGYIPDYQSNGHVPDPMAHIADSSVASAVSEGAVDIDADGALAELVEKADNGDRTAMKAVRDAAITAGVPVQQVDDADNYAVVLQLMKLASGEQSDEAPPDEAPAEEPWQPKKGDSNYKYQQPTVKGKKPTAPISVEVTAVNFKNEKVDLLSLVDRKTSIKGVPWAQLIRP